MKCHLYYQIRGNDISLVMRKSRFPYDEVKIDLSRSFFAGLGYYQIIDLILKGGEEKMKRIVTNEIREIERIDGINQEDKDKEKEVLGLHSTIEIEKSTWKKLRKKWFWRGF